ncbi:MAG: TatD family hydrolase [Candidatus Avelusimicrobium sp.]|uniref:TatD family hydrolase n=1 Tax=Candidatus Avelusimicrobium sp. TaxID=3048833 RepID=UPI003EFBC590
MKFIDSHAHLNDPAFDPDRGEIIVRLPQAGVTLSVEIGCAPEEWQPALDLSARYPAIIRAVLGVHPEYAPKLTKEGLKELETLLRSPYNTAVGEIGLDYTCLETAGKDIQHDVFTQMLGLASKTHLPIVLHVRREGEDYAAYDDTFSALKQNWTPVSGRPHAGVLHCFCARYEEAKKALDHGLLLGINGCFTYKKNEYIREAVKKAGADKIIFETDCPYLAPQGKRGTRNDPSNIPLIAQFTADYLNIPLEKMAHITTKNARELYGVK